MTHVLIVALLNVQYYRKFIGNFQHILGNGLIACIDTYARETSLVLVVPSIQSVNRAH